MRKSVAKCVGAEVRVGEVFVIDVKWRIDGAGEASYVRVSAACKWKRRDGRDSWDLGDVGYARVDNNTTKRAARSAQSSSLSEVGNRLVAFHPGLPARRDPHWMLTRRKLRLV